MSRLEAAIKNDHSPFHLRSQPIENYDKQSLLGGGLLI